MELQTIRQKLQTLKASPPETIAAPWGQARQATASPNLIQVKTAIDTLRQRSEQPHKLAVRTPSIEQFNDAVTTIEQLAGQQQEAFQRLQTVGHSLIHQIQPGESTNIDELAHFLRHCQPVQIPLVKRTPDGYLDIAYHVFNFRQAEHDATSNAATLRRHSKLFQQPLPQGTEATEPVYDSFEERGYDNDILGLVFNDVKTFYRTASREVRRWLSKHSNSKPQRRTHEQFTLLDSAIWGVLGIIIRLILKQIFQIYPALWTPIALLLVIGVFFSLYLAIFTARPNPILGYRTLMVVLGLLIGGRLAN